MSGAVTAVVVGAGAYAAGAEIGMAILAGAATGTMVNQQQAAKKAQDNQEKALQQQQSAQAEATARADKQASDAQQAMNKANQKAPDMGTIMDRVAGANGGGGTMLTGSQGVDPNQLQLGKNTLLGS